MSFRIATKLTVPLAFFGYAAFGNVALFRGDAARFSPLGFMQGEFTGQIDSLYRANLPHREPAVGLVGAARYLALNEGRDGVVAGDRGWLFTDEEYRAQQIALRAIPATLDWMKTVQTTLAGYGTNLVLVPIPAKIEIDGDHGADVDQIEAISKTYDTFVRRANQLGLHTADTRDALFSVDSAFFQTDTHWTSEGASAVAHSVAESRLIAQGLDRFDPVALGPVLFEGDLVSFVTSKTLAPMIGLNAETVTPYIAQPEADDVGVGSLDLFGTDSAVPAVLVGTSYSANPNWSFVEALKVALAQDVLNYAQEGRGPIAPMVDYLNALEPADAPPVVIWEFPVRYLSDPTLLESLENGGDENA